MKDIKVNYIFLLLILKKVGNIICIIGIQSICFINSHLWGEFSTKKENA